MSYSFETVVPGTGEAEKSPTRRSSGLVRSFLAALAVAALSGAFTSGALATPAGPGNLQSCQLGPNGENPCPDAGSEDDDNHPDQSCTLGYGPDGKLGCVDESEGPDDLKSCDPDPLHPEVNPCGGGGENGGGENGGSEDGGGEDPDDKPVDSKEEPYFAKNGKDLKLAGGIVVPTRVDTGAGGSASPGDGVVPAVTASIVAGIAIGSIATLRSFGSAGRDR